MQMKIIYPVAETYFNKKFIRGFSFYDQQIACCHD